MAAYTTEKPPGLSLDSIPFIDMTTLTQSELRALSLCSSSSFDPYRTDDIVTPIIDRSIFNESIGSRRQTFSRPSSHYHHHRHRLAGLLPKATNPTVPNPPSSKDPFTDSDRLESHSIISLLKQLLSSHPEFQQLDLVAFDSFSHLHDAINFTSRISSIGTAVEAPEINGSFRIGGKKRKRGRKPKVEVSIAEERERAIGLEIVNKNGVVVDFVGLANMDDPYREELKRRTEGMDKEEELLGFFRDLEGQWCSRRRKRKIVDASEFGDILPVGWKLLLGLKRKAGRAWVYCRRYISPGGQQFVSCKEVSSYLQSFFGPYGAQQVRDYAGADIQQIHKVASGSPSGATRKEEDKRQSSEHEKAVAFLGIENLELAEVQIRDLFECRKCNLTFDERDTYLQHLLSFHQRTTRKYRLGSSVGDGVIVKDGKYECQFCHKIFHERRRYNGHVGIHVRNYVRGIEESPGDRVALQKRSDSPTKDEMPARISKMDALIEIAQNSIRETASGPNGETSGRFSFDEQNVAPNQELLASVSDHELKSDSSLSEPYIEYGMIVNSEEMELHQQKIDYMIIDEITQKVDDDDKVLDGKIDSSGNEQHGNAAVALSGKYCSELCTDEIGKSAIEHETGSERHSLAPLSNQKSCGMESNMNLVFINKQDDCKSSEGDKTGVAIEVGFGSNNTVTNNSIVNDTVQQPLKEDGVHHGAPELPVAPLQPSPTFSAPSVSLHKGENELSVMDQRNDRITGFDELRLEEIEQLKFSFGTGPEVPLNMVHNSETEGVYGASIHFESEGIVDTALGQQFTTVCVWCGVEFSHEAASSEMQSDSVGYMCPTCKARISGQLNGLGSGCS